MQLNSTYRRLNLTIPSYLHNGPPHFTKHRLKPKFSSGNSRECDFPCVVMIKGVCKGCEVDITDGMYYNPRKLLEGNFPKGSEY